MPPQVTGTYQIDDVDASGDEYVAALEQRCSQPPDVLWFTRSDGDTLVLGTIEDRHSTIGRIDADEISWDCEGSFPFDETVSRVGLFLSSDSQWDDGLVWVQTSISSSDQRRRLIPLVIIGITLIFLALGFLHD